MASDGMMQDNEIVSYLGEKLLADLRSGASISSDLFGRLVNSSVANTVRPRISIEDAEWIRTLLCSKDPEYQAFGVSLVRPIQHDPDIRKLLFAMWDRPEVDENARVGLIYRLLDYPDLEESWHRRLFKYIQENGDAWFAKVMEWYGERSIGVAKASARLVDPDFPESKKWVYLLQLSRLATADEAVRLISPFRNSEARFVAQVADDLVRECTG